MAKEFRANDLFLYQTINEINCVSSLDIAACTVESIDKEQDSRFSAIWTVPLDGSAPRQFTSGSSMENTPRWSPDGTTLAFLSDRHGPIQIFLMHRNGGEAVQLGNLPGVVMNIDWSPDGKHLLAICSLTVDPELRGERQSETATAASSDAPRLAWRLPYKMDCSGYLLDKEKHLFIVDALNGSHRQLTDGAFNVKNAGWSPDSKRIAYTRTGEGRSVHCTNLWLIGADGQHPRQLSDHLAITQYPKWSPDGQSLVFTGSEHDGDAQNRLWCCDLQSGSVTPLGSEDIEVVSGNSVYWSADSAQLLLVVARRGRQHVVTLSVQDGSIRNLVGGDRQIDQLAIAGHHLVFASEDGRTPNEVHCTDLEGKAEARLSNFNAWWVERNQPVLEARTFTVPDGQGGQETIEGWVLGPSDRQGPTPLLVDVHGGPASYVFLKYVWHRYWYVLISEGWTVLALNPVGSSSFGRKFSARLRGRWGELDLGQHLAAVRTLQEEGLVDDRLAITGKSYGGYLAAWAVGQTDIFRAAVISAPVANLESHCGTSDSGYYSDPYALDAHPYLHDISPALSPVRHAAQVKTPTLILQGEADERCPKGQSEELFSRLINLTETPAELVLYPGGSHHFFETGKPSHCLHAVSKLVDWVKRHACAQ